MAKLTLQTVLSGIRSLAQINANFAAISAAFERVLFRDGTAPNAMSAPLDMNTQKIINLAPGLNPSEAITKGQLDALGSNFSQNVIEEIAQRVAPLIEPGTPIQPITLSGPLVINVESGQPINATYAATGGSGTSTFTLDDAPGGITIGLTSGILSGTLTNTTPGSYAVRITATDAVFQTRTITVTIAQTSVPIVITESGSVSGGVIGSTYTSKLYTISGGSGPYSVSQIGGVIPNITRVETPTTFLFQGVVASSATPGTYNVQVQVSDGYTTTTAIVPIVLTAVPVQVTPIVIDYTRGGVYNVEPIFTANSVLFPVSVRAGTTYDYYWSVQGGVPPYSYAILNSSLPDGVTFNIQTGRFSGIISSTEGLAGGEPFSLIFRITDSVGTQAIGGWNFQVLPAQLVVFPFSFPNPTEAVAYDSAPVAAIVLSGGTKPYTKTDVVSGTKPSDLSYVALNGDANLNIGWKLTGTPTSSPSTDGTYNWVTRVTSADGQTVDIPVTITINPAATAAFSAPTWLIQPSNLTTQEFVSASTVIEHDDTYVDKNDAADYRTIFVPGPQGLAPGWQYVEGAPGSPTNKVHQFFNIGETGVASTVVTTGHRFDIEYSEPTNPVASGNEDSWARRSTATGVIRRLRFDSIDDIAPAVTPRTSNEGFYYAGQTSVDPTAWAWDTTVKASGTGSLRLLVKKNSSLQTGQFGYYLDPIVRYSSSGGSGNMFGPTADNTRKEVWIQCLWRPSSSRIRHMFNNDGPGSKGAEKIFQIQTGLHDALGNDSFPIVNWAGTGTPGMYWNSPQAWGSADDPHSILRSYTGGRGSDRFYQTGVSTATHATPNGDNQARDNWGPGQFSSTWGSFVGPDNYRDLGTRPYVGGGYQFAVDVFNVCTIRWRASTTPTAQDGIFQCWWSEYNQAPKLVFSTNQLRTSVGINSIHLTQFMTGKVAEGTAVTEDCFVWFDELITSRNKINHPGTGGTDFVIPDADLTRFPSQW